MWIRVEWKKRRIWKLMNNNNIGPVFVELNDGSTILNIQIVCEVPAMSKEDVEAILKSGIYLINSRL